MTCIKSNTHRIPLWLLKLWLFLNSKMMACGLIEMFFSNPFGQDSNLGPHVYILWVNISLLDHSAVSHIAQIWYQLIDIMHKIICCPFHVIWCNTWVQISSRKQYILFNIMSQCNTYTYHIYIIQLRCPMNLSQRVNSLSSNLYSH